MKLGNWCGCLAEVINYSISISETIGPCPKGHLFSITEVAPHGSRAECRCKSFHARAEDGACYRLYTRGPCGQDEMIARGGRCTKVSDFSNFPYCCLP